jgi:hypothetical protein
VPVVSPDEVDDDADSKLVASSKESSTVALKSGSSDVIISDSGQQEAAAAPDGELYPIPLKKKRSLKEVLRTRSRSLTRSLSWKKNKDTKDVDELDDSQTKEQRSISRSRSGPTSHTLKQDTPLAISILHVTTPVTPSMETPVKSTPSSDDATPRPLKKKRSLKDRLLLTRPRSITNESDFTSTLIASPPASSSPLGFAPPRITVNQDTRQVVHDAFLVQSRGVKTLASSPREPQEEASSSSSDEGGAASRYAIPASYSQSTDKPVTRGRSDKTKNPVDYVMEERHWGSKAVRRIRSHQSDAARSRQSQASEATWIPTEEDRYKMASAFIFGEDEFSNLSVASTWTGFTGTTDNGDTSSIVSQSTGIQTGMFSLFTDYTEDTGVTSTKTNETGYTMGSGDTSESSDTNTYSYTEGTSFVSSRITAATDETSLFDLGLDYDEVEDTPIEKHVNHRKRYDFDLEDGTPIIERKDIRRNRKRYEYKKAKKSKNVFLEVISDLRELRTCAITTCLPCQGY